MNTNIDDLTFSTMYNIMQSGMWLLNDLENYLRPLNMSHARLTVLLMLKESNRREIRPKDIAKITGKSKPAITRMVEKLLHDGLISIDQDELDGRVKKLSLTGEGNSLLKRIVPEYNKRILKMSSSLSNYDKLQIKTLLKKVNYLDDEKIPL